MARQSREIKRRIRWELVEKSPLSALIFFTFGIIIFFYQFDIPKLQWLIQLGCSISVVASIFRYSISKMAVGKKLPHRTAVRGVIAASLMNLFGWTIIFATVFSLLDSTDTNYFVAFAMLCGFITASIVTLANAPWLAIAFQTLLVAANMIPTAISYRQGTFPHAPFMILIDTLYLVYLYKQTWDFYKQSKGKYTYEVKLEESMRLLKISNQMVVDETLRAEKAERLAALVELAGGVAHEINNPLAIISGAAEQVRRCLHREDILPEDLEAKLDKIMHGVSRINRIVRALLNVSVGSDIDDNLDSIKVAKLIEKSLQLTADKIVPMQIQVQVHSLPEEPITLRRQTQICQVLSCILDNAADAMKDMTESDRKIRISVQEHPASCIIELQNEGTPISESMRRKLFQPFFTTKEVGEGSGLSLSLSRGIMQSMGGDIWHDYTKSKTTFCVRIPKDPSAHFAA